MCIGQEDEEETREEYIRRYKREHDGEEPLLCPGDTW